MNFKLSCGDAMPGCDARFEAEDRGIILDQVSVHAREAHGVVDVTPEMLEAIGANIVSV